MYNLEFLPIAKKDMDDIVYYISNVLNNRTAAINLSKCFVEGANSILNFPYGSYKFVKNLKNVYRSIKIKNFLMFYTINETKKVIFVLLKLL